jgi:hypothetical protein
MEMNHEIDTPRTDALPSDQNMLTAQSDPVELYQKLCSVSVLFEKSLDACVEYRKQLDEAEAEVKRLRGLLEEAIPTLRRFHYANLSIHLRQCLNNIDSEKATLNIREMTNEEWERYCHAFAEKNRRKIKEEHANRNSTAPFN